MDPDFLITRHHNAEKVNINAITPTAMTWVWRNLDFPELSRGPFVVSREGLEETIELMKKDGFTVIER